MSLITIIDTIIWSEVKEIADMVLITPPQSWGTFVAGGHPQTPDRKYPAPLFQLSKR